MSRWAWYSYGTMLFTCMSATHSLMRDITSSLGPPSLGWCHAFPSRTKAWRMTTWSPPGNDIMVFTAQLGRENQVGYLRVRSHSMKFRFFSLTIFIYLFIMMGFSSLTIICSSAVFTDKRHTAPRLSLVNVNDLNRVLRFEVFVSEDRQLRAVHLI